MVKPLTKELLDEAFEKLTQTDVEGWINQVGVDLDVFTEKISALGLSSLMNSPVQLLFTTEDSFSWLLGALSASFEFGWYARNLQKDEGYGSVAEW